LIVALFTVRADRSCASRRRAVRPLAVWLAPCALLAATLFATEAFAQAKLEARYRVTLAGLPIGSGGWTVNVNGNSYTMSATGETAGLASVLASGSGQATSRGVVSGTRLTPSAFNLSIKSRRNLDRIRVAMAGGAVKGLTVDPPPRPAPDHQPLTDEHKRGVLDPISAGLLPASGGGAAVGPDVCRGTLPVFDGRQRFDLALSYKRMEQVKSERGYSGPAVVCAVRYTPLGGYYSNRTSTKFLRDSRDIEIWYAPIAGTRFVATYRIAIPTLFGQAVLQATQFESSSKRASAPGE
jgi:hypothetical protein